MTEVVPFPIAEDCPESLEVLVNRARELAKKKSECVYLNCGHLKDRMSLRKVSSQQIFDVLKQGKGVDGPFLDMYGCWRIKLEHFTAGRAVQVVVVVKEQYVEVITVIDKSR